MKQTTTKRNMAQLATSLGLNGNKKRARKLAARARGKPIELQTRVQVAMLLLLGQMKYREIAEHVGVAIGSISNIKKRLLERRVQIVRAARAGGAMPSRAALYDALRDRPRVGGASKRKIGSSPEHAAFLAALEPCLYHEEMCALFERRFGVRVSVSTMCRFRKQALGHTRQRVQKQLPQQALSEKNVALRRTFVGDWFVGADRRTIGTNDEQHDQSNWRLRLGHRGVTSVDQLFWIDETGCNRHTLLRRHGYGRRGGGGVRRAGLFDGQKGRNHSVIIAIGRTGGVIARHVLVGDGKRGTRRDDFCSFLRKHVGPAMLRSAARAGVPRDAPLLLMMDNASIHKGVDVSNALKRVSTRLGVAYQPPYMPTVNPVELVNNQLKAALKKNAMNSVIEAMEKEIDATLMDPQGGVVFDAPINRAGGNDGNEPSLREQIEAVLDRLVQQRHVAAYIEHCGWRD